MDRSLWNQTHSQYHVPGWRCPTCQKGTVKMVPKSFQKVETASSKRWQNQEDAWPGDIEYISSAWGECTHEPCKERFSISGIGGVGQVRDQDGGEDWAESYAPISCLPMPQIIEIPKGCPDPVTNEIKSAFALFWMSRAASVGRLRVALEYLLDHLKIDRQVASKKGEEVDLTLHKRIAILAETDQVTGEFMEAVKWLANTGTHEDQIPQQSLLDAFELVEFMLGEVIEKRSAKMAALAKKLIEKYKPKRGD